MKIATRITLSAILTVALVTGNPVFAQTTLPSANYQNMFAAIANLMAVVKAACSTDDCVALTVAGTQINNDGRAKYANGQLVGPERDLFFKHTLRNISAIQQKLLQQADNEEASLRRKDMRALESCKAHSGRTFPDGGQLVNVATCDQVYAAASAICSLYTVSSPIAAAICAGAATYGYVNCLKNEPLPLQPPTN